MPAHKKHEPRLDGTQLVGLLLETLLLGIFYVLLIQTFEALWFRAKTRRETIFKPMAFCAVILTVAITGRWILDVSIAFEAFIRPVADYCVSANASNPAETTFQTLSDPKFVAGSALYVTATVLGDGFMVYRLWIVWGKNKLIVILPVFLLIALAVTGGVVTYLFDKSNTTIFLAAGSWITCSFVLTFICNLYSTTLIALRIFLSGRMLRKVHAETGLGLSKVTEILVESAALYSCCVITSLVAYLAESNVQFVMVAMNNPMIGIIFCMIVTRAHRTATGSTDPSYNRSGPTGPVGSSMQMRPVAIKITTQSQMDGDLSNTESTDRKSAELTPPSSPRYLHSRSPEGFRSPV